MENWQKDVIISIIDDCKEISDHRKSESWTAIHHQEAVTFIKVEENEDSACLPVKVCF